MNKAQIKAELRRSACEDEHPRIGVKDEAYWNTWMWRNWGERFYDNDDLRTFFLLVAEAL